MLIKTVAILFVATVLKISTGWASPVTTCLAIFEIDRTQRVLSADQITLPKKTWLADFLTTLKSARRAKVKNAELGRFEQELAQYLNDNSNVNSVEPFHEHFIITYKNGLQGLLKNRFPENEFLAYQIDRYFGFYLVPPTILNERGSIQLLISNIQKDPNLNQLDVNEPTLLETFDQLVKMGDRNVLSNSFYTNTVIDPSGHLWAIDNEGLFQGKWITFRELEGARLKYGRSIYQMIADENSLRANISLGKLETHFPYVYHRLTSLTDDQITLSLTAMGIQKKHAEDLLNSRKSMLKNLSQQ